MPGQHDHGGAEPQRRRTGSKPGQEVQRRRDLAIAGEMVLDDKGAAKAERLGLDIVFDEIAEAFAAVELGRLRGVGAPRCRAAEQTELHMSLSRPQTVGARVTATRALLKTPVSHCRIAAPRPMSPPQSQRGYPKLDECGRDRADPAKRAFHPVATVQGELP